MSDWRSALATTCAVVLTLLPSFASTETRILKVYIDRQPTPREIDANYTGAKFEPRVGCYIGAFLDLDSSLTETYKDSVGKVRRVPKPFEDRVGKPHATYFYYMLYGTQPASDWIARLGNENKIVHIALEPNNGLEYVRDDQYLTSLAQALGDLRTPVFMRFASEMNGPWVKYSGNPKLYKEKFRLVSQVMKKHAPNVAMVWCPYTTPTTTIDTYYPGDDVVDWVGVNLYSVTYHDQDPKKPASHIHPTEKLDYVYQKYSARKPIMVGEFGATHFSALENRSTVDFAQRSISAMYLALPRIYPRVKCINYFNANNLVLAHRKNNNYAVTQNDKVLETYRKAVSENYFLSNPVQSDGYLSPHSSDVMAALPRLTDVGQSIQSANIVPVKPLLARSTEKVSGGVMFSAWTRDISGNTTIRFKVDGRTFWLGKTKSEWRVELDTRKLTNGPHKIEVTAHVANRVTESRTFTIDVQN